MGMSCPSLRLSVSTMTLERVRISRCGFHQRVSNFFFWGGGVKFEDECSRSKGHRATVIRSTVKNVEFFVSTVLDVSSWKTT